MDSMMISGAKYSEVPKKLCVLSLGVLNFLAKPKSTKQVCPYLSINTFSGFKSRKTTSCKCKC